MFGLGDHQRLNRRLVKAAYTGAEALTFNDYIDLGTGLILAVVPGGVYDVAPASGRMVPDVPPGWFTPVEDKPEKARVRSG